MRGILKVGFVLIVAWLGLALTGFVYSYIGQKRFNRSDPEGALQAFEQALKFARMMVIGNQRAVGSALVNIGVAYHHLGDHPQTLASYEQALRIHRKIGYRRGEGKALTCLGMAYRTFGDHPKAWSYLEQALRIYKEISNPQEEGEALRTMGQVYAELGDYPKALTYYQQALKIAQDLEKSYEEGAALNDIGDAYERLDNYQQALTYYQQALEVLKKIGSPFVIRTVESGIGIVYLEQGKLQEALEVFKRVNMPVYLGRYYLRAGEYQRAREEFTKGLQIYEEQRNAEFLVASYIGLGLTLEGLKDYVGAKAAYQKAVEFIERQWEAPTEPQKRQFLAAKVVGFSRLEAYEGLVRVSAYLKDTAEGFFWAENTKARLFLEAVVRRPAGNLPGIPEDLSRKETDLINRIAAAYKQMEITFEKKNTERYQELEQELAGLKKEQETLIARLRREYPEYASIRHPEPLRVSDLRLKPEEVLIEYEVTEREAFAWLIKEGKVIKAITIPITRKELTEQVKRYRGFFEGITSYSQLSSFDPQVGNKLYKLLFKDFTPLLKEGDRIIIVPDEILGILPFEALVVELSDRVETTKGKYGPYPQGVKYLGDAYPISYYQSATALTLVRTLKGAEEGKKERMLLVADPVFDPDTDERVKGRKELVARRDGYQMGLMRAVEEYRKGGPEKGPMFPRLEKTGQLAERLKLSHEKGVDVLSGLAASEPELGRCPLQEYGYQVYATHGILDNQVPYIQEPALVLSQVGVNTQEREQDGFWTMSEVMGRKLDAEIAALIACETGVGKNVAGEGVMGMGRAFQYAGAKAVLMSLWSVAEESTTLLTEKFFTYLKEGKDKLEALRLARADVRKVGYEHPFFWAPFILVGER